MRNFFRKDLNLNNRWWHRFLKVIFLFLILLLALFGYNDFNLTGYSKISALSEYIKNEPQTVQQIINNINADGIVVAGESEPTNGEDYAWVVPRDGICAKNFSSIVKDFESKGYELYTGSMFERLKGDLQSFLNYLEDKNIECIIPTFYTGLQGQKVPMIQTYEDSNYNSKNIFLYKQNNFKTFWYIIFGTYFSDAAYVYPGIWFFTLIPALVLILLYYKGVIYIIFGPEKKR